MSFFVAMIQSKGISGIVLASVAGVMLVVAGMLANVNDVSATKYESSEASAGANECGNGDTPIDIFCQNLASQIEGDGNAIIIMAEQPPAGQDNLQKVP
jgi:hypothetical protein